MFSANCRRRRRRRAQFVMQILILTCTANDAHLYNLRARALANTYDIGVRKNSIIKAYLSLCYNVSVQYKCVSVSK